MYSSNNNTRSNSSNTRSSNSKKRAPRFTAADLARLAKKIDAFRSGEEWAEFLRKIRQFYHYSPRNMQLIYLQRPDAGNIASFRQWKKLGRKVKKGEKGIAILVPNSFFKIKQTEEEIENKAAEEFAHVKGRMTFRVGYVFDESQTEGAPVDKGALIEKAIKIDDSALATQELFDRIAAATDYKVVIRPWHHAGECNHGTRLITIDERLTLTNRVKVLAHEVTHAIFQGYANYSRADNELIADSVSYAVLSAVGIDSEDSCARYLATWGANLETLTKYAQTITKIAQQILQSVFPADPASQEDFSDADDADEFTPAPAHSAPATPEPEEAPAPSAPEPEPVEDIPGRPQRPQRARDPKPVADSFIVTPAPSTPAAAPEPAPAPQRPKRARKAPEIKPEPTPAPSAPESITVTVAADAEPLFFF